MFNLNSHEKVIYVIFFSMMILCGCTDESEEVNTNNETTTGITTRAVVWLYGKA